MNRLRPRCVALLAGLAATLAGPAPAGAATLGLMSLPQPGGAGPVTVFYATEAAPQTLRRGPFTLLAAPDAPPAAGNGRLVVMSHGSGGGPWVHTDLARQLVDAGFVVAMPVHVGDHAGDDGAPGPDSWDRRPAEVSATIDRVASEPRLAARLDLSRVGLVGQSAGGHTGLVLAGGRWSPARFAEHCLAHLEQDFNACVGLFTSLDGGWLDGPKRWLARAVISARFAGDRSERQYQDARIAAVVAGVPAAAHFDATSLARPRVPLALITAAQDVWLHPQFHSDRILAACAPCERLAERPDAGHNLMLSPLPPGLDGLVGRLLADPPGYDRPAATRELNQRISGFLLRTLQPR
ncbi:MAG: dienelactone hydrolase [Burkholderiaceae bacterium]|nr:dienelactone hydrolase [Burkholderiaceae bacterium]